MPQYRPFESRFRAARHECRVNGALVDAAALTVREMNFGQHFRTPELPIGRYEVRVDRSLVAEFLEEELRELRAEHEPDAEDLPDVERALAARGWPPPARVLDDPKLGAAVVRYFGYELLLSCLSADQDATPRWVINSVERVELDGSEVLLGGEVGRADLRRAYQDY